MIKGRYVATVEIEFTTNEKRTGLLPFEQIRENMVNGGLTSGIRQVLHDELFDSNFPGVVKVTQQFADVYKVEDEHA